MPGQQNEDAHEFSALNTLLLVVLLGLCILSAYLIKKNKIYYLPESAAAILVGVIVGGMARLFYPTQHEMDFLSFNSELFYFLLLPPIIFEAGYALEKAQFFRNIGTIAFFAVLGTLMSTFVVGYLTYVAGLMGLANIDVSNPMEPLMFGALISAVDPVATLSIMGSPELNCDRVLYSLVFGESVLNDAVAIVLFRTFLSEYNTHESFSFYRLPSILWSFALLSLGSLLVGALLGLACSFLCKHTRVCDYPKFEVSLLFLFSYGSYAFAEAIELSGIMALFFNGLILSHYNSFNLSPHSKIASEHMFAAMSTLSEFWIFLYMGMGVFTGRFRAWDWRFILIAILCCLVGRAFNVFPFSFIANIGRRRKITFGMQVVMWFAGLRGAIAFALSQSMPGASKDVYASTTLMIVIFTTLVCGGLTEPLMTRMNVQGSASQYEHLQSISPAGGRGSVAGRAGSFHRHRRAISRRISGQAVGLWTKIEASVMQPIFGGGNNTDDGNAEDGRDGEEMTQFMQLETEDDDMTVTHPRERTCLSQTPQHKISNVAERGR